MTYARAGRSERVRLVWWTQPCTQRVTIHWAIPPQNYHAAWGTVVGVEGRGGTYFDPQGVLPALKLPAMSRYEKATMLGVLRVALIRQTGLKVKPISGQIVDWEGHENEL